MNRCRTILLLGLSLVLSGRASAGESFLNHGDYWVMTGDSITNIGTFERLTARVVRHFHPEAPIRIGNSAVNGVTADYEAKVSGKPTVVTIMLGMNDAIHQHYPFTPDVAAAAAKYRETMTKQVRKYQAEGASVVLLTPTYTDERLKTAFENAMTRRILEAYGDAVRMIDAHFFKPNEFWGDWILPSCARNDPAYGDQEYWRGRIWAPMNWLVYLGLRRYDLPEARQALVDKSRALLLKEWREHGHVHENYCADTGAGCNAERSDPFYHWGGLLGLISIVEENES